MKRSPLKRNKGLKQGKPLRAKQPLKRSRFVRKLKVNEKNFTPEQIIEIWTKQDHRCAHCKKLSCWRGDDGEMQYGDIHHKKKKSHLVPHEIDSHGPGGGLQNGVGLCRDCHTRVELNDPEMARYRTLPWQEIGSTEQDWKDDLSND
jgi:hypothetical protein